MSIDQTKHSLFGASKVAADVLVQEYGRYFGMPTVCFRGGCLTGPAHAGTELHGFLSYLMKCAVSGRPYRVFGYKGKQVRDNIHSFDLVEAFAAFVRAPRVGEVYNIGGSRHCNCSMLEAIALCEEISGRKLSWEYVEDNRIGDHIWWISDVRKFREHYPEWNFRYGLQRNSRGNSRKRCNRFACEARASASRAGTQSAPATEKDAVFYVSDAHGRMTTARATTQYCSPSSSGAVTTRSGIAQTFTMTAIQ